MVDLGFIGSLDDGEYVEPDYSKLYERFPDLSLDSAGGACPFQAEGMLFGMPFYFRYRHGIARLNLGVGDKGIYLDAKYTADKAIGDMWDGTLNNNGFIKIFTELAGEIMSQIEPDWPQQKYDEDALREFAEWIVSLDDDDPESPGRKERRTVSLTQIINRAKEALG